MILLRAEGPAFCAGHDLREMRANPTEAGASKPLALILTLVLGTGAWAALIMGFTLLGLGSLLLGLIAVMPMLGHASWHAYRDLVDASGLVSRDAPAPEGGR